MSQIATLRAFLDESGTHSGSRVVVVAGYVISSEALPLLEREWQEILQKHSLSELHMKEFVPPNGQYSNWNEKRKRALLEPLIALVHQHSLIGVGAALEMTEFMNTTHAFAHSKAPNIVESPYQWCLRYCIVQAARWAVKAKYPGLVQYTLDQGCHSQGRAQKHFKLSSEDENLRQKYRLGSLTFGDSKKVPAIQCADLLAYEMYKEADRVLAGSARPTRGSFLALFRGENDDHLATIDPEVVRRQVTQGMRMNLAILDYLPSAEKFQVMCHALRRMKPKNRETLFDMMPSMRRVYSACIAKGEMGKRLDKLPKDILPPDEYILAKIDSFEDVPE